MSDDLQNYKLQLQQVEAALLTDPDNQELLKLKADLEEVIELTKDLIQTQLEEQKKSSYIEPANSSTHEAKYDFKSKNRTPVRNWKAGDKCMAKWNEDGQLYDATIESINYETGDVNVVFEAYQNRSTASLLELKERKVRNEVFPSNNNKRQRPNQKEYLKKKKQKKTLRLKELEEEREVEKNKWLSFTTKNSKKTAIKPKSIFASPDTVAGRVGIGTCGVSGKPMTNYSYAEKYRKGV